MSFLFFLIFGALISLRFEGFTSVESDLNRVAKECRQSEVEVSRLESDLSNTQSLYYEKTAHLVQQQKKITRLILLLKTLKEEAPSRIISEENSAHVLHHFSILKCYVRTLQREMQKLQSELLVLKQTRDEKSQRKKALDDKLIIYQKKYAHLEHLLQQRKTQIQKTVAERRGKEEQAQKIANRSANIADLIKRLEKEQGPSAVSSASSASLSLLPPVEGPILVPFDQKHPQSPDGSGVVFRARSGAHVLAPISGKILYAGAFRRYNKILIIGFGKTYSLLLTGLNRLDVSVGQSVKVGDPLGKLSDETKNYLYLELRNHSIPIRPNIMKL
jgi:murein hydrolase activator